MKRAEAKKLADDTVTAYKVNVEVLSNQVLDSVVSSIEKMAKKRKYSMLSCTRDIIKIDFKMSIDDNFFIIEVDKLVREKILSLGYSCNDQKDGYIEIFWD